MRRKGGKKEHIEPAAPVTDEERLMWKGKEVNRLLRLAEQHPEESKLYTLAAERVQREADAIQRLIDRASQSSGIRLLG